LEGGGGIVRRLPATRLTAQYLLKLGRPKLWLRYYNTFYYDRVIIQQ
jgi:hypothetical protein